MIQIKIPIKPLSVNKAWCGRRFKTKDYKIYERSALCLIPRLKKIEGLVEVHYKFYVKNWKVCDGGNFEKLISDIIVKAGLIEDDRFIMRYVIDKIQSKEEFIEVGVKKWRQRKPQQV